MGVKNYKNSIIKSNSSLRHYDKTTASVHKWKSFAKNCESQVCLKMSTKK